MEDHPRTSSPYAVSQTELTQTIGQYYNEQCSGPVDSGRSWEFCYRFFHENRKDLVEDQEVAAIHLGFYLASWGMYRRGFLPKRTYKVHKPIISVLASSQFEILWKRDVGARKKDFTLAGTIMGLVEAVEAEYKMSMGKTQQKKTDTLVTKVLLGTVGCLPARDSYFERGFKLQFNAQEVMYGSLNRHFVDTILKFCIVNRRKLRNLQEVFRDLRGHSYPVMKLVDMYFWQKGKR